MAFPFPGPANPGGRPPAYLDDLDFDAVGEVMAFDETAFSVHTQLVELTGADRKVLEVGCASGYMSERLQKAGCRVTGIDFNRKMAEKARRFCVDVAVLDIEKEEPDLDGRFDVIIFADILEHLRNPLEILQRYRELLADRGRIILSVPNVANWRIRLRLLRGNFDWDPNWILSPGHIKFFTRKKLTAMLSEAGLRLQTLRITYDLPLAERRKKGWLVRRVADTIPGLFAKQFIAVAERAR
jgi:2-polyprenyl-3-methyl-5-hydroxy-6-metoxy-1,4-benzoquinol methylase